MFALISLLSFFLPTQLAIHLNSFPSTVYGFRIDYLIPTIYLTDIIVFLIIIVGFRKIKLKNKHKLIIFSLLLFTVINTINSSMMVAAVYKWIKVFEMILLGIVVVNQKKFSILKHFLIPLSFSLFIVTTLGILQYLFKGSVGGPFYLLGERSFIFNDPNIAPYPYSTFSHPNSFAGFLLVFGILFLQYKNKFNQKYFWTLSMLIIINLILTNSLNVYIAIGLLLVLKFRSNFSLAFFAFDFSERFITHRIELIQAALTIVKKNFLIGVGLNNFIPNLVKVSNTFINSWELQPVHNIFLLIFSETGIIGFVAFVYLIFSSFQIAFSYPLLAILLTGLNDHYWITLQQNILLLTFVITFMRIRKK